MSYLPSGSEDPQSFFLEFFVSVSCCVCLCPELQPPAGSERGPLRRVGRSHLSRSTEALRVGGTGRFVVPMVPLELAPGCHSITGRPQP